MFYSCSLFKILLAKKKMLSHLSPDHPIFFFVRCKDLHVMPFHYRNYVVIRLRPISLLFCVMSRLSVVLYTYLVVVPCSLVVFEELYPKVVSRIPLCNALKPSGCPCTACINHLH